LPPVRKVVFTGLILSTIGWAGLVALILFTRPTLGPRWLFFFLFVLALSGTALPIVAFLNRRFPSRPPADGNIVLRQAIWVGIYGSLLAWLQLGRVLNLALIVFLAGGFVLIEFLLRLSEKSRWQPKDSVNE
jgi:hypothetical protein